MLVQPQYAQIVMDHLLDWIASQELESLAVLGLLALIRASIIDTTFKQPPAANLHDALCKPSILSVALLRELGYTDTPEPDWTGMCTPHVPQDFVPQESFQEHCRTFIPPVYYQEATALERRYNIPFVKHWAYEWQQILDHMAIRPSSGILSFRGRPDDEYYGATDFCLSEVYRSAYLRTLAWAVSEGTVPPKYATYLATESCPVDPALWKVKSGLRPGWWPEPEKSSSHLDTVAAGVWQQIEKLWDDQKGAFGDYVLGQASGCVSLADTAYDLEIQGCFQKCIGATRPDLSKIMEWHASRRPVSYVPHNMRFEGVISRENTDQFDEVFADWMILPAAVQIWPRMPPRWQFWRMDRGIWFPLPFIFSHDPTFECTEDSVTVFEEDRIVSCWKDWASNLKEKTTANLPPPTGQYLLIDRDVVESFTREANCSFCWTCKLTHFYREHSFEKYKTFSDYHEYGASNLISF
jgi:hypothetical protein